MTQRLREAKQNGNGLVAVQAGWGFCSWTDAFLLLQAKKCGLTSNI